MMEDLNDISSAQAADEGSDAGLSLSSEATNTRRSRRRLATVYDAVAGKVWYDQVRANEDQGKGRPSSEPVRVKKYSTREMPFAPEEVLFRRKNAPERYAEHDIYHAHERDLPHSGRGVLPGSDLLKAIHAYSSRFYGALECDQRYLDGRNVDERSMDETALLALGILLEEAGKEVLGRRGDLVFTEGDARSSPSSSDDMEPNMHESAEESGQGPGPRSSKRRKLVKSETSSTY